MSIIVICGYCWIWKLFSRCNPWLLISKFWGRLPGVFLAGLGRRVPFCGLLRIFSIFQKRFAFCAVLRRLCNMTKPKCFTAFSANWRAVFSSSVEDLRRLFQESSAAFLSICTTKKSRSAARSALFCARLFWQIFVLFCDLFRRLTSVLRSGVHVWIVNIRIAKVVSH